MAVTLAVLLSLCFGAADQYAGSLSAHPWAADVSLLSAPWLVLAFLAGWSQRRPERAALLGLVCTVAALVGYGLMTLSPIENAHLTARSATAFAVSEQRVFIGALVTGPLFGWLGNRWRTRRAWAGALLVAAALCLEPAVHAVNVRRVGLAEVAVGMAMAIYVAVATRSRRADSNRGPFHYE